MMLLGDGTSPPATVLGHAIVKEGLRNVAARCLMLSSLKRGIDKATAFPGRPGFADLANALWKIQNPPSPRWGGLFPLETTTKVGPPRMIASAMDKVGREGVISLGRRQIHDHRTGASPRGCALNKGYLSPYFVNRHRAHGSGCWMNPTSCSPTRKSPWCRTWCPWLEQVARAGKPLMIIAEDIEKEALATLVVNRMRGGPERGCR